MLTLHTEKRSMSKLLLVGSSIFEAWTQLGPFQQSFSISNRAVGGTTTDYWVAQLADILAAESPDLVLFYCGSNDLNNEVPPNDILANLLRCRTIVRQHSVATAWAYFSIIKAPQKYGKWELIDRLNLASQHSLPTGDLYVETNQVFCADERPIERFFVEDGLHLTAEAYATLATYALPRINAWFSPRHLPSVL